MKQTRQLWRLIIVVAAIFLLTAMILDFNGRVANLRRLTAEKEQVNAIKENLLQTQSALQEAILYATSEAAGGGSVDGA